MRAPPIYRPTTMARFSSLVAIAAVAIVTSGSLLPGGGNSFSFGGNQALQDFLNGETDDDDTFDGSDSDSSDSDESPSSSNDSNDSENDGENNGLNNIFG